MGPEFVESSSGEVIFTCHPDVQVTTWENSLKLCSNCLKQVKNAIKCENCKATVYCNPRCMKLDDLCHKHECGKMQQLMEHTELIRLTLRHLVTQKSKEELRYPDLEPTSERRYENICHILDMLTEDFELPRGKLSNVFEHILHNCLTVYGPLDQPLGFAVYKNISSKIEHSCVPNAELSFSGNQLQIISRVNRRLKNQDKVLISYVDKSLSKKEKRNELKKLFNKNCSCYKCNKIEKLAIN